MELMVLYNTGSPKRGSSDIENVLYDVALYTTGTTGLFYLFALFCAPSSAVHHRLVRGTYRPRQTRCYVERRPPTNKNSLG